MNFKIEAKFQPNGDQPEAISNLVNGINTNDKYQTLLGVTGSGKTFTIANVIKEINRPTLVLSHNKTLAAQLFSEFKQFFPNNAVEYFVSYYDYYQPEAYLPATGTYIEKDLSINEAIEKYRLSTTSSLLSNRKDIIVVASVSCIYGIGNPDDFYSQTLNLKIKDIISKDQLLEKLVVALYSRSSGESKRGTFRVKGDTIDIFPSHTDMTFRIHLFGNKIEDIERFNTENGMIDSIKEIKIFPANIFVTSKSKQNNAIREIQNDLRKQITYFEELDLIEEAKRLKERTEFDLEMMKELGYCSGIENYSRYFDGRDTGSRPFCLLDYFSKDYITIIDESHVTIPQIRAMHGGDRSRKETLVTHGFRLPAALDNRPLKFEEFEEISNQTIYMSATPGDHELKNSGGIITEQIIRPTGLLDPEIDVRSSKNQIDNLLEEIQNRIKTKERVLITTLTKRMSEELTKYLKRFNINCCYIHSDVETIKRIEILSQLRDGYFDVLVGVNLLREGLDLPEVSLVVIMDADKEGFLRSEKALTQTAGRAARNLNGMVIMYADKITNSMQNTIKETNRRREKQKTYNKKYNITPKQIQKRQENLLVRKKDNTTKEEIIDPIFKNMNKKEIKSIIKQTKKEMEIMAKGMNFIEAAKLRDQITMLKEKLEN
ncbi:MAG: excinuclease ABC subunit UvrB [Bacteroidota bacterium]|nr:excinuclease ABC subunit UvrB [Bacteroidota bacterium]